MDHTRVKCIKDLKNVTSLSLMFCDKLININELMSTNSNLNYLDLSYCDINDVSALGNIHTLILKGCENITNVSNLINVSYLDLSECINIADISALKNVYNLNLTACQSIRSVDMLTNVSILNLNQCYNIKNVSNLKHLKTLYIHPYPVEGIEALSHVDIIYDY